MKEEKRTNKTTQKKTKKEKEERKENPLKENISCYVKGITKSPRLPTQFPTSFVWLSTPTKNPLIKTNQK